DRRPGGWRPAHGRRSVTSHDYRASRTDSRRGPRVLRHPRDGQEGRLAHVRRYDAPLRSMIVPEAHSAAGVASQCTAAAIPAGRATRWNGLWPRTASPSRASASAAISVSTKPGATAVTAIPRGARATARDCVIEFRPALLAPYATCLGSPRNAPREETLMMRPPRPMWRAAHHTMFAALMRLTSSVLRQTACQSA